MEYGNIIYSLTTLTMHSNIIIMYPFICCIFPCYYMDNYFCVLHLSDKP